MRWTGELAGVSLPSPVHVPPSDPLPIVKWLAGREIGDGRTPHLSTYASAAVRLCEAARAAAIGVEGAQLTLKRRARHGGPPRCRPPYRFRRGAAVRSQRGGWNHRSRLSGPAEPDEIHLFRDLRAVIQPEGLTLGADLLRPHCCSPRSGPARLSSC